MVDREYSTDTYKSVEIRWNSNEKSRNVVPDYLETKKMYKYAVKKLPHLIRYVPHQYKTRQICDLAILENGGPLKSVSDCYKKWVIKLLIITFMHLNLFLNTIKLKKCEKAVNIFPSTIEYVPD